MDLARVQEFLVIARCGSLRRAAAELGVSPATLSARFSQFEQQLGVPLFRREDRRLRLTGAGTRFLVDAREIVQNYGAVVRDVRAAGSESFRQLTIAAAGGGLPLFLGPYLDLYNRKHPDIRLRLLDDTCCSIEEGLRGGLADLYCAVLPEGETPKGTEALIVSPAEGYALLPARHPLAGCTSVGMEELDGERFILYPETKEPCIRRFQLSTLEKSGISYSVYDEGASPAMYHLLVPIGKGIVLVPERIFSPPPNTVSVTVKHPPCQANNVILYSASGPSPDTVTFLEGYREFCRKVRTR